MSGTAKAKVSIIGAGAVGSSMAYACLIRRAARIVALYDVNRPKVEAEVLDLAHGGLYTGASDVIGGDDLGVVEGSRVVVITAGAKQKPGQSRLALAETNVSLLGELMPRLMSYAPEAVYVLVTNPCDVLTVAAVRASGLPTHRVLSTGTMLDTSRLRMLLARRAGVAASSVHANIVGEHGDSEFALWSQARIGSVPIKEWTRAGRAVFTGQDLEEITEQVRTAAYRVIEGKGATNYAIGLSGTRLVEAIVTDENAILPVSSVHAEGVAYSLPSLVNATGVGEVLEASFTEEESAQMASSVAALRAAQTSLGL